MPFTKIFYIIGGGGVLGAIVNGIATIGSGYLWLAGNHHGMDINFYKGEATPVPIVKW